MDFRTPGRVVFGRGSVAALKDFEGSRGVIVTGRNTWRSVSSLVPLDFPVVEYARSSPTGEPFEGDILSLANSINEFKPELIVAIGGGSVIDSVKLARAILAGSSLEDMYRVEVRRSNVSLVSVETTSGTGTGISAAAVVIDSTGLKRGIVSPNLMGNVAIYDANFVMSMPGEVAINSGMDALTHAIEAYTSNVKNVVSDTLALKAIELIYQNLRNSVKGDEDAREKVHHGNMLAAMGFTNSRLGLCHAASHKIGGRYGIPHGRINAILLPYVVRVNERYTDAFRDVARVMGVDDVAQAIMELNREFEIPDRVELDNIPSLAREIERDALMKFNPRKMSKEEIEKFLKAVSEGGLDALQ